MKISGNNGFKEIYGLTPLAKVRRIKSSIGTFTPLLQGDPNQNLTTILQNLRHQKTELMGVGVSCEDSKNAMKFQISANLGWRHLLQVLLSKLLGNFLTSHIFAFLG